MYDFLVDFISILLYMVCILFVISAIDDLATDILYVFFKIFNKDDWNVSVEKLRAKKEKWIALFVPAWRESEVIADMVTHNLSNIEYQDYDFFVGVYPNDKDTVKEVDRLERKYPRVYKSEVPHDGPTNKADCLNWIYQRMKLAEENENKTYDIIIMHDSEDIIHPLSFKLINYLMPEYQMVQIPVFSLEVPWNYFTAGTYCDEFAEHHIKNLAVRERVKGFIPSAGVGTAFSRDALDTIAQNKDNLIFNTDSLTEDYEIGLKFAQFNFKQILVRRALKRYFQDLVNLKDLSLRGRIGEFKVEFPVPRDGELLDSSHAFIRFEHSAMLDPRKSSLGLFLNYRGLTTVRLDAANVYGGQLKQPFPLYQVRDFNVLTVTAGQLLEIECTPPFDPALWTSVCGDSYLYLSYFLHQVKPDLAWFPYPFHDVRQPLPEPIYFLSTPGMDHELFSRYLELAFYFGTVFGWHRGDICWIESLDQWGSGPLVVAGTSAVPLIREWTREFQGQPSPLAKNTPALLKFFLLAQKPVLLISGNTTEEVHHAFDALLQTAPAKLLNSSSATIKEIHRKDPDLRRFLLGKIEPRSISFKELGIDDFTLRGSDGQEKTLEIPLLFGTSIPEHEAYMELVYSYSAQNNTDISNIEIRTNQVPFSSIPLMERKGVTLDKESLQVPHHLINGPFRLSFYGHFYPVIIDPCRWPPCIFCLIYHYLILFSKISFLFFLIFVIIKS